MAFNRSGKIPDILYKSRFGFGIEELLVAVVVLFLASFTKRAYLSDPTERNRASVTSIPKGVGGIIDTFHPFIPGLGINVNSVYREQTDELGAILQKRALHRESRLHNTALI